MRAATLGVLLGLLAAGCGKKGPPLAPFVHIPGAVQKIDARRVGGDVYLTVTVPAQNIDGSTPADLARIDIFAATATEAPPVNRFFDIATRIATIEVPPALKPGTAGTPAPRAPTDVAATGPAQGTLVTIREALSAEALTPRTLPVLPSATPALTPPPRAPQAPSIPRRFYLALPFSDRGRGGPGGPLAEVALTTLPDPPSALQVSVSASEVRLAWQPSGGLLGFLLDTPLAPEASPLEELGVAPAAPAAPIDLPAGPTHYNVYRTLAPHPIAATVREAIGETVPSWNVTPALPVNSVPVTELAFADVPEFERARCYTVRAVRGTPPRTVEGIASEPACVRPTDVFPPAPPTGLTAVAAEGVISLIWEPNVEDDLSGYIIFRGVAGGGPLAQLTPLPLEATQYSDRTVAAGVRYVYAVVAVDNRVPLPNVSSESPLVEETAR
jgi:hypothetical protein